MEFKTSTDITMLMEGYLVKKAENCRLHFEIDTLKDKLSRKKLRILQLEKLLEKYKEHIDCDVNFSIDEKGHVHIFEDI